VECSVTDVRAETTDRGRGKSIGVMVFEDVDFADMTEWGVVCRLVVDP
jgi:hypothetical protein